MLAYAACIAVFATLVMWEVFLNTYFWILLYIWNPAVIPLPGDRCIVFRREEEETTVYYYRNRVFVESRPYDFTDAAAKDLLDLLA